MPDFIFHQERMSNVCLLTPVSDDGEEWIDEHMDRDAVTWFGPRMVIETRYMGAILEGIAEHNLTVEAA